MEPDDLAGLAALDDPLRRRLYDFVCRQDEPVGREAAAAAAGISRSLAAYHLDKLAGHGLLATCRRRPEGRSGPGAGRPAKLYARAERDVAVSVPARDYGLAARLLAEAAEEDASGQTRAALARAARRLGREAGAEARGGGLEALLRERGYEPFEEDGAIRLRNCPFHAVKLRHPEIVCGMNLALLEGVADGLGDGRFRPVLDPRPGRCCVAILP